MRKFKHEKLWSFSDEHVIDGMIYSNDIEKWVKHEFGYEMKRKGTISYRSSSLFVKEKLNTLEEFF